MIINNLCYSYSQLNIFNNFSLKIKEGRVTTLLGPSGCGKTTLLNLISGTLYPKSGEIIIPSKTQLSYLFQEDRLLPWKTVEDNVKFVLEKLPKEIAFQRTEHYLRELELYNFKKYYPRQLSGGMKQRCSIARAFAYPSNTILMDEPFKGLDLNLKLNLIKLFNKVWREEERTSVFVTHDINDAVLLGDDIIVLTQSPVTVLKKYINPLPHNKRSPNNPDLLKLESSLYKDLTTI